MSTVGQAYSRARVKVAARAARILPDTCRLIAGTDEYEDTPCKLKGNGGNSDGAPYRIRFAWDSPAVIGAGVVIDAIEGRTPLTLQLVAPADSSTSIWQDWQATSAPAFGRTDVGL